MQLFVSTGGSGVRLYPITRYMSKPLVKLGGVPILEHILDWGKKNGVTECVLLNGHLRTDIIRHFLEWNKWDMPLIFADEPYPMGVAGALKHSERLVYSDDFAVIHGDTYCYEVDLQQMMSFHKEKGGVATVLVHISDHPEDSDKVEMNEQGRLLGLGKEYGGRLSSAGIAILSPRVLEYVGSEESLPLETGLLLRLIKEGQGVYCYYSEAYCKDVGTPSRLFQVESHLGQPAVLLDRDGVIIEDVNLLEHADDVKFIPRSLEAIALLNESDLPVFIISNQPVVGRGIISEKQCWAIERYMEEEVRRYGGVVDDTYMCFHHPTEGDGEYRCECDCRKPAIGMFLKVALEHNVALNRSYYIGDMNSDIVAGRSAGCKTILVRTGFGGKGDDHPTVNPDIIADDLYTSVRLITELAKERVW